METEAHENNSLVRDLLDGLLGREIRNVHARRFTGAAARDVGLLIDGLGRAEDGLWPSNRGWPPMRFARRGEGLQEGLRGGHGPIGYMIESYEPGRRIVFRFRRPAGFSGVHFLEVVPDSGGVVLRHEILMHLHGRAVLAWPFMIRALHDALLEDALDNAERILTGRVKKPAQWSWFVRGLMALWSTPQLKSSAPNRPVRMPG